MSAALFRWTLLLLLSFPDVAAVAQRWMPTDTSTLMSAVEHNQALYERMGSYTLNGTASAFRDIKDATAEEREPLTVWRSPLGYKAEHFGLTTLQDANMRVLIDPEQHIIYLSEPTDMLSMVDAGLRGEVFALATAMERSERPDGVHFRLTFPQGANYASLELVFDGKGWLRRMETCWGHTVAVDPEDPHSIMVTPKTVMELGAPQPLLRALDVDPGQVVAFTKEGAVAKGAWQGYQVFDTRVR